MRIGIVKERRSDEMRVAATPDTVKKFIAMGLEVNVEKEPVFLQQSQIQITKKPAQKS